MDSGTKQKEIIENFSTYHSPSLIIDKGGKIIAYASELKVLVPNASAKSNFFDLFDEDKLLTLQKIFIDVRKYETPSSDYLSFVVDNITVKYEVVFTPLRSENNIYFLINFRHQEDKKQSSEIQKFWVATSDLEKITEEKKIHSIINKVKLSYPFTFIEKAKIQKEINELEDYFWIKDVSGKFVLINDKYSDLLGFKSNQLENKDEADYLPKYLVSLYKTVDSYIYESTNTVIFEGIGTPISGGANRNILVVEFPLCDLDNKVVAIIGFSQKSKLRSSDVKSESYKYFFKDIPIAVAFINNDFKLVDYSDEFTRLLNINEKINLSQLDITKIFEKEFLNHLEEYLKDHSKKEKIGFNYIFTEKGQLNTEVSLKKIFDENNEYLGVQISFSRKMEEDFKLDVKAKMYDALIEHSPEAIFIYDIENLKFLEVNETALKFYGYKRNDFLNMDLTDLYAPEDIQTLIQTGDSKMIAGSYIGPWKHKKSDGTTVLVELRRSTIEFKGKKAHLNLVRNVSDQADSKKRSQILEALFENTNELIINTDKDGFITSINESVSKKLGYSKKDLETRPFISLVADDYRAKINKNIFHSGLLKTISIEVEIKKGSGTFQKATVIATPIKNYSGDVDSFSLILKLVEEPAAVKDVKKTQDDITGKIDPPFLSNVFHEILTPINVILGFTQELSESINNPNHEQKEAVEIIKENQKLLLQIMDNAVDYSTLEQKVIKFKPEELIFGDLIAELKENTRKTAEDKKVELVYGKISSSIKLETDRQKFISLISLFIKFAIQITKENSIILSASTLDDKYCVIGIKDTRDAITPYALKAFNDIFSDDESMTRRNYGFSRFSVKLAKKLIELLSVQKRVITKGPEAVEYALVFPLQFIVADKQKMEVEKVSSVKAPEVKTEKKVAGVVQEKVFEQKVEKVDKKQFDLSQLSCLYLEDQVDSQLLFKVQLKELKNIEFAPSFEAALPLLKTKKFDFILMDINLQGEYNGLDALRIIQKMPGYQHIPVIASTAYALPDARDSFIAAGFSEFISKPLLRERLLEAIKKLFV